MSDLQPLKLTERETQLLVAAWQSLEGPPPKVDMEKVATITGYTKGSAGVLFGALKKKLKTHTNTGTTLKATPKKKGAGMTAKGKRTAGPSIEESPSKKSKAATTAGAPPKAPLEIEDKEEEYVKIKAEPDDDDNTMVKIEDDSDIWDEDDLTDYTGNMGI